MNNFLISVLCGVIVLADVIAAHFGWLLARRRDFLGGFYCLVCAAVFYFSAVAMSYEAMYQIGTVNGIIAKTILLVPIIISITTSAFIQWLEKQNFFKEI